MASSYIGEIRMFAGNFAPQGWAFCEGQLLPISENETLFNLIGTTYGGDGQSTFGLPDLRGRVPLHQGNGFVLAERAGTETVTITAAQIPAHSHQQRANAGDGNSPSPVGAVPATSKAGVPQYGGNPATAMHASAIAPGPANGGQPHENMMPYLAINFIISLFGIYPTQN